MASLIAGGFIPQDKAGCPAYHGLAEVTKDTKLIISHWQCRDQPGYQPRHVDSDGMVYVSGDAGSWSGPYGSKCSPQDVARYWLDTKAKTRKETK